MLPRSKPTPRTLELQAIVDASSAEMFAQWPIPTRDDFLLIGIYIVLFSYIDLNLRRMVEVFELADALPHPIKGKVANLTIVDVQKILQAMPDTSEQNRIAFENIVEFRGMRNLMAHFAIKRFPTDDAFVFLTKSARDYKREFGRDPKPGVLLTAVVEVQQIRAVIPTIEALSGWLSQATTEIENQWLFREKKA